MPAASTAPAIAGPCDGRVADIKAWSGAELTTDLVLRCNGSSPVLELRKSKEQRPVTPEQWTRFWKGVDVARWPTEKQCAGNPAKPPAGIGVEYHLTLGGKEYAFTCRDTQTIPAAMGEIGGNADTLLQATAPDDVKMFGNELDRLGSERKSMRVAATQLAVIVATNDAEAFLAHVGGYVTIDGKRLTKDKVVAAVKADGVQKFTRIQLSGVEADFPHGTSWRLVAPSKGDTFGLLVGSGYGQSWVLRAHVAKDGTWSVDGVEREDLGQP